MSITFYHCLHVISVIIFVSALTTLLLNEKPSKVANMILGIFSFLIFLAGFGLIAKLKLSMHSLWLAGKLGIWLLISVSAPIIAKRFAHLKRPAFFTYIGLLCVAIILAFTKLGV